MGETREQLTRPLLRARLTEQRTGLVAVAWQPWFELVDRVIRGLEGGLVDVEANPEQGDVAVAKRLGDPVETFSDVPQLAELVNRAFDLATRELAGAGDPVAADSIRLGRKPGDFYQRFGLAT